MKKKILLGILILSCYAPHYARAMETTYTEHKGEYTFCFNQPNHRSIAIRWLSASVAVTGAYWGLTATHWVNKLAKTIFHMCGVKCLHHVLCSALHAGDSSYILRLDANKREEYETLADKVKNIAWLNTAQKKLILDVVTPPAEKQPVNILIRKNQVST